MLLVKEVYVVPVLSLSNELPSRPQYSEQGRLTRCSFRNGCRSFAPTFNPRVNGAFKSAAHFSRAFFIPALKTADLRSFAAPHNSLWRSPGDAPFPR